MTLIDDVERIVLQARNTNWVTKSSGEFAREICQLFPKSPDNPDGKEPESEAEGRGYELHISELKPDKNSATRKVFESNIQELHAFDTGYFCGQQDARLKAEREYTISEIEMYMLSDEEIEKLRQDWINEDWATRTISLSRGDEIEMYNVIAKAQYDKMLKAQIARIIWRESGGNR